MYSNLLYCVVFFFVLWFKLYRGNIEEEQLIEYVHENPISYNFNNKLYRNQLARKETWDEIGKSLASLGSTLNQ